MDDLYGEAKEVFEKNPWLTYGEPLHRLREFGFTVKEIDWLDERPLTADEIKTVVRTMYGFVLAQFACRTD